MADHATVAQLQNVSAGVLEAVRKGAQFADPELKACTACIQETRVDVMDADLDAFHAAGYTKGNILDVVLGADLKTLSNNTNRIAERQLTKRMPRRKKSVAV